MQGHAGGWTISTGVLIELHDVDLMARVGNVDAHPARELVAGNAGMDGVVLGRPGHAAIGVVGLLIPEAFDLSALVAQLESGIDPVVGAGATQVLRQSAASHLVRGLT